MDEALIQEQERQLQKTGRYYKHVFWLCVPLPVSYTHLTLPTKLEV